MVKQSIIKLNIEAGKATAKPPLGPILGQQGINIPKFCLEYNTLTAPYIGLLIPVYIKLLETKAFSIKLSVPSSAFLLKKFSFKGTITFNNFIQIVEVKYKQLFPLSKYKIVKTLKQYLKLKQLKIIYNE